MEYKIQMPQSVNDYVQAQKLAHILNKAQQQRSSSNENRDAALQVPLTQEQRQKASKLYSAQSAGQLHTLPDYSKSKEKSQDLVEKEFLAKIDKELRSLTNSKLDALKN